MERDLEIRRGLTFGSLQLSLKICRVLGQKDGVGGSGETGWSVRVKDHPGTIG